MKGALGGPQRIMGKILDRNMWHGFATGGQRPAACVKDLKKILDNLFTQ